LRPIEPFVEYLFLQPRQTMMRLVRDLPSKAGPGLPAALARPNKGPVINLAGGVGRFMPPIRSSRALPSAPRRANLLFDVRRTFSGLKVANSPITPAPESAKAKMARPLLRGV